MADIVREIRNAIHFEREAAQRPGSYARGQVVVLDRILTVIDQLERDHARWTGTARGSSGD